MILSHRLGVAYGVGFAVAATASSCVLLRCARKWKKDKDEGRSSNSDSTPTISLAAAAKLKVQAARVHKRSRSILIRPASSAVSNKDSVVEAGHDHVTVATGDTGILVHGCHMQADGWLEICWGDPPDKLGRIPQGVLLALEEDAKVLVFGTGASVSADGILEGQYTLNYLMDNIHRLHDFSALKHYSLEQIETLVRSVAIAEVESQNTVQEVKAGFRIWASEGVSRGFLVSSPTHLPRCLACACEAHEAEQIFAGAVYACPSETSYQNYDAGDVVVVEPPHRGDRDKRLDEYPFHEMVRRSFRVNANRRIAFLQAFDALLKEFGV